MSLTRFLGAPLMPPSLLTTRNAGAFANSVINISNAVSETHTMRMQQRLDAPEGREQYGQRFATVGPVFANVRYNRRLDRFTLQK